MPEWASALIAAEREALAPRDCVASRRHVFAISYEPIAGCFFNGDDPLQLMRQVPDLLAFRIEPREAFPPLADLDPYACNLRLQAISAGGHDEIARVFRLVPDQVRIARYSSGRALPGSPAKTTAKEALIGKVIEAQAELLRIPNRKDDFAGCVGAAARSATNALRHGDHSQLAETVERAKALALSRARCRAVASRARTGACLGIDGVQRLALPKT